MSILISSQNFPSNLSTVPTDLYLACNAPQFFASDERIKAVRKMIMAANLEERKQALGLLLPYQRSDFEGIFRAMDGRTLLTKYMQVFLTLKGHKSYVHFCC